MGTLVIRIPEDINAECEVFDSKIVNNLLKMLRLKSEIPKPANNDILAGMFSDDTELMDQFVECAMQARERDPLRCDAYE
jgi:hypothetical protein